jgi:hypothetical protein
MTEQNKQKTALVLRMGGVGDSLILIPTIKELNNRGYKVDFFCGSPTGNISELFSGLPFINQCKPITRIQNIDCIQDNKGHYISVEIVKKDYDEVFDYKHSIELNRSGFNLNEGWRTTINSNYINWIDLSLAWANIDPTLIFDKSPQIKLEDKYLIWAQEVLPKKNPISEIIGVQLQASTLIRTWYKAGELPNEILKSRPDSVVLVWADKGWFLLNKYGKQEIKFPEDYNPLCCSAALIAYMNCFIASDSGMSHIAEALGIHSITIYTTVPAWTRNKYYKYSHHLEAIDCKCFPCFTLDMFCPLKKVEAETQLTQRERDIIGTAKSGVPIQEAAKRFSTVPKALDEELGAATKRLQALSAQEPDCVKSITSEMIINRMNEILPVQKELI